VQICIEALYTDYPLNASTCRLLAEDSTAAVNLPSDNMRLHCWLHCNCGSTISNAHPLLAPLQQWIHHQACTSTVGFTTAVDPPSGVHIHCWLHYSSGSTIRCAHPLQQWICHQVCTSTVGSTTAVNPQVCTSTVGSTTAVYPPSGVHIHCWLHYSSGSTGMHIHCWLH
jgi:hypothetical protein